MAQLIVSHPTGNRNVKAVIESFEEAGILQLFATTIAINAKAAWLQWLPSSIKNELLRRSFPLSQKKIKTHPLREAGRMILPKLGLHSATTHETGWASVDKVYRDFDKNLARHLSSYSKQYKLTGVYAYEDGALSTFSKARQLSLQCVYDLPIAYWETIRKLLLHEAERLPQWAPTLGGGISDSDEKLARKTEELKLADIIVTPSKFVAGSLPHWAKEKKVIMTPFGSPELSDEIYVHKPSSLQKPLRILFVGSMGQRKGLGDLFAAMKQVNSKQVELVVMGSLQVPMEFYKKEYADFVYEPGRPYSEVLKLMASCDVFCLPSVAEGRALVTQEAMSQGLPLIITPNTGGEDLVIEGKTGFLIPIDSPGRIAEKIDWFASHREQVYEMGQAAKQHAATYTWKHYGNTIIRNIEQYSI